MQYDKAAKLEQGRAPGELLRPSTMSGHYSADQVINKPASVSELISNIFEFSKNLPLPKHIGEADFGKRQREQISDAYMLQAIYVAASARKDGLYRCSIIISTGEKGGDHITVKEHENSPIKLPEEIIADPRFGRLVGNTESWPGFYDPRTLLTAQDIMKIHNTYDNLVAKNHGISRRDKGDNL